MLRELTTNTGAVLVAIGSTLFFFTVFAVVVVRVLTRKAGSYDAVARLPLDETPAPDGERSGTDDESSKGGR